MKITVDLKGSQEVIRRLRDVNSRTRAKARQGMDDGALVIMDYSRGIVPLDTGALRASSFNEETANTKDRVEQTIGYGHPAAGVNPKSQIHPMDYAVIQHENATFNHLPGRTYKYLERAMYQRAHEWVKILKRRLSIK